MSYFTDRLSAWLIPMEGLCQPHFHLFTGMNHLTSLNRKNVSYKSRAPYPHSLLGYDRAGFRFAPRIKKALTEASLIVMLYPSTMPQLKRLATAPATWAAATEVPVRVVMGMESPFLYPMDGPLTSTPGDAKSGLTNPPIVYPRPE